MVFFAIWWALDELHLVRLRLRHRRRGSTAVTLVQMAGALVVAAGIPPAFADRTSRSSSSVYVIMRLAMVGQWLRAAGERPAAARDGHAVRRRITLVQVLWVAPVSLPPRSVLVVGSSCSRWR